jgi:hypothetical protein
MREKQQQQRSKTMQEDNEMKNGDYDGKGLRGALWAAFGVGTAAAAKYVLGEGGLFGGGGQRCNLATQRDLEYERALTVANAETAALKAQLDCRAEVLAAERRFEDKLDAIEAQLNATTTTQAVLNAKQQGFIDVLAGQVASIDRMTARYFTAPVMAASEAALSAFNGAKPAAASSGSGS